MSLTINLPPDLERRLQDEAARSGLEAGHFVVQTLSERLSRFEDQAPCLPYAEAELLEQINIGLAPETWERYHELIRRRRAESLTQEEQTELIGMSDEIETANARRIESLVKLAHLRGTTLPALMDELGIQAPPYG